jgi:rhamnogalacturonan endolyase
MLYIPEGIMYALRLSILSLLVVVASIVANVPGGGSTGANVTVTEAGGNVTMSNGIVTLVIQVSSGTITSITSTLPGSTVTRNLLAGGYEGGKVYWELESGDGVYTLLKNPATDSGNCAVVQLFMNGQTQTPALDVTIDYALLRGNTGFYVCGILSHPAAYAAVTGGEWRVCTYLGGMFDWLSVDAKRNKKMITQAAWESIAAVTGAPPEVELVTQGPDSGQYECKYGYSADFGEEEGGWGWSSDTDNIGIWFTMPSLEYYQGGPKKREITCQAGPAVLNMWGGDHYAQNGMQEVVAAGATMRKIYGPFFVYLNQGAGAGAVYNYANTASHAAALAQADSLFHDAQNQSAAEQSAWPYTWFNDTGYKQQAGRATVTGTFAINDTGLRNASPANMWIGLAPDNGIDFQFQFFTYEFWVKTGAGGTFTIPHVLPGTYALYAFGPGDVGTFKYPTDITVAAGQSLNLGTVTWTPPRTASTIWQIGIPDRDSHEFLNGDSLYMYWQTSYINYTPDFGTGITYTVGTSVDATTWNYSMMNAQTWKVNFTLPKAPTAGTNARLYVGLASSLGSNPQFSLNGTLIGNLKPPTLDQSDAVIRMGSQGAFWDTAVIFNANLLKAGANTLTITQGANATLEWDCLRMEAAGTGMVYTGVTNENRSFAPDRRANSWRGTSLVQGDGIHGMDLMRPDGRIIAHADPGQTLNLSRLAHGVYLVRCGARVFPVSWTR